jgi:hypothetical protein
MTPKCDIIEIDLDPSTSSFLFLNIYGAAKKIDAMCTKYSIGEIYSISNCLVPEKKYIRISTTMFLI